MRLINKMINKIVNKITKRQEKKWYAEVSEYEGTADILFVNGCELEHPFRYRVLHQKEQLEKVGYSCHWVYIKQINRLNVENMVKNHKVIIIYRCPFQNAVSKLMNYASKYRRKVLFDIDDLVIDTVYTNTIPYVQKLSNRQKRKYDSNVLKMKKTMLMTYGVITTTQQLQIELLKFSNNVFINRNTASEKMVELSEKRLKLKENNISGLIRIGYFSGSITHNADIELIAEAVQYIMEKHRNVMLCVVGELNLPEKFKRFEERIVRYPFVDWKKLPEYIASVDINICPLENTIFNAAKSEIKWIEAALVKVPTVASRIGAFEEVIDDGVTGVLCSSIEEWKNKLDDLISSEQLRKKIANKAYDKVHSTCLTDNTGIKLGNYLMKI